MTFAQILSTQERPEFGDGNGIGVEQHCSFKRKISQGVQLSYLVAITSVTEAIDLAYRASEFPKH
jgi:hypothetical protein